jgi:PD-(D/E)XK endonuclease
MPNPNQPDNPHNKKTRRKPAPRKNTKVTGERSEAAFLYRASNPIFNFGIAKPWGDSRRYDFILDNGRRLHRIQIKCTESIRAQAYETRATYSVGKGRAVYTKDDIDFIAAHVVPLDIWYIIPVEICTPAPMLRFYPHRQAKKMRLEPYREAWHLLQEEDKGEQGKIELQASADESTYPDIPSTDIPSTVVPSSSVPPRVVILSEASASRSEADAQSKDLCTPPVLPDSKTTPTHLPPTAAPWPIPPLKILTTRKGPQILPPRSR